MSNYECASRTNYFSVTNEEAFESIAGKLTSNEGSVSVWSRTEDEVKKYAFGAYGEILYEGIPLTDSEAFLTEMQAILPDSEAFVIEEMGHEKLRYLSGVAYIITKHDNDCIDFDTFIRKKVHDMTQNNAYECELDY